MPAGIVYLFAKEPVPGLVKSRLCPPLTSDQAAALAEAFLKDMLGALCPTPGSDRPGADSFEVRLAVAPGRGGPVLAGLAERFGLARCEQGEGDLGERMERVMEAGLRQSDVVALVGGDLPDLPPHSVDAAFEALRAEDGPAVALGPSFDGGYYLVAARRPVEGLFRPGAAWGGPDVLAATRASLDERDVGYTLLPPWWDVDDEDGLALLRRRLHGGGAALCPSTAKLLASFGERGGPRRPS